MITYGVEGIAARLVRKGFGPEWAARMGIAAKFAAALDPETPPYALAGCRGSCAP